MQTLLLKKSLKAGLFFINKNPLSKFLYQKEIALRSKLPLTSINKLSKHINIFSPFTNEIYQPNDWYGHAHILKSFLNFPQDIQFKFVIEHGVVLSEFINTNDTNASFDTFITSSQYRAKIMKKYKKMTFSIGPYLHYARHYLSQQELLTEKRQLGKTLLVFPSHSTLELDANYDNSQFCNLIKKIGDGFKTIRVCLYWRDVLRGLDKFYLDAGFECVSAGHILDPNFLPRLKSIIYLSDYTFSNDAGSHVGYCVLLNKPHLIKKQEHKFAGLRDQVKLAGDIYRAKPYLEVLKQFSKPTDHITLKQREIINKYWGLDQIRTKDVLLKIVD